MCQCYNLLLSFVLKELISQFHISYCFSRRNWGRNQIAESKSVMTTSGKVLPSGCFQSVMGFADGYIFFIRSIDFRQMLRVSACTHQRIQSMYSIWNQMSIWYEGDTRNKLEITSWVLSIFRKKEATGIVQSAQQVFCWDF